MNAPAKPWSETTPAEKRSAVKALILKGVGYTRIAEDLGAPNRHCVAGVVSRLRDIGELPPAPSKQETGASGGAVVRAKAKDRRDRTAGLHAGNIANKVESRKSDPGMAVTISRAAAFEPLPNLTPINFAGNHGCRWPVDGLDGPGLLACGAPKEPEHVYCAAHRRLAYVPRQPRPSAAVPAAERLF